MVIIDEFEIRVTKTHEAIALQKTRLSSRNTSEKTGAKKHISILCDVLRIEKKMFRAKLPTVRARGTSGSNRSCRSTRDGASSTEAIATRKAVQADLSAQIGTGKSAAAENLSRNLQNEHVVPSGVGHDPRGSR